MKHNCNRRHFLTTIASLAVLGLLRPQPSLAQPRPGRIVFIHGRSQQGLDQQELKTTWIETLKEGAALDGRSIPETVNFVFPYYGDTLDQITQEFEVPITEDIQTRGSAVDFGFLEFQAQVAEDLRKAAGISETEVDLEYGNNVKPRGPQNWEWVQAILRTLDKHAEGLVQSVLETFMRDVYLYTRFPGVSQAIDRIVIKELNREPAIVIGHSLGSVVAYNILQTQADSLNVPLFVTVGSPLAIRSIRDQYRPISNPRPVRSWFNAYDKRDVVALYPLDEKNFRIAPAITNFDGVRNQTDNRHGIVGYLNDKQVAARVLDALGV